MNASLVSNWLTEVATLSQDWIVVSDSELYVNNPVSRSRKVQAIWVLEAAEGVS
jgi:hypothetical protein